MGYGAPTYIDAHDARIASKQMEAKGKLENMLGTARFERYYLEAGGDMDRASCLYRWNTNLGGAFYVVLSDFEVLTRNSMDRALREWNLSDCGHSEWALEHQSGDLLYSIFHRPMMIARGHARKASIRRPRGHDRKGAPITHDDVIAQFSLGNWSTLLGEAHPDLRDNARDLWEKGLCNAFPNVAPSDQSRENIGKKFERITQLRNRVSHQENLLDVNVRSRLNDVISVLSAIDTAYPSWVSYGRNVRRVTQADPRKLW